MSLVYIGKKVPKELREVGPAMHLGDGVWAFAVEPIPSTMGKSSNGNAVTVARVTHEAKRHAEMAPQPEYGGARPKWIRVTGPAGACGATVGRAYRVARWCAGAPRFKGDDGGEWWGRWPRHVPTIANPGWEPASRPAPKRGKAKKGGKRA